jgi:hypothetical protein
VPESGSILEGLAVFSRARLISQRTSNGSVRCTLTRIVAGEPNSSQSAGWDVAEREQRDLGVGLDEETGPTVKVVSRGASAAIRLDRGRLVDLEHSSATDERMVRQ